MKKPKQKPDVKGAGLKFDGDKLPWELAPYDALSETMKIYQFGCAKYGSRNWEKGMSWGRIFGSICRHMFAWWRGEDRDPESKHLHLAHVCSITLMLLAYQLRGAGTDDRPKGGRL